MNWLDGFTVISTSLGVFFFFAGTVGLLRFPDVLSRLHALTKADNLGLGFIVLGLLPQMTALVDSAQLILTWVLVMIAGSVSSFLIASYKIERSAESWQAQAPPQAKHGQGGPA